tara:strand:- start:109 stop:405 length:297 start_codon:yes stop_codon:yes gene_type:complete
MGLINNIRRIFNDPYTRTTRRVVERRVRRYDPSRYIQEEFASEWAEVPVSELDDASYAQRLEEEKRYQRSRATELSEQHEGMGREYKEIPDPWLDSYK